ncbi:MAG: hypothetical protein AAF563_02280 [Pseudomonadota bacterium]
MARIVIRLGLVGLLAIAIVAPAQAELSDWRQWDDLADDEKTEDAIAIRCAGLTQSMLVFEDDEAMSSQTGEALQEGVNMFTGMALIFRGIENPEASPTETLEQIRSEVDDLAARYIARMEDNVARSGKAFASDELILFDFGLCQSLLENLGMIE